MTISESLLAVNSYPIPLHTVAMICLKRGLTETTAVDSTTFASPAYRLAVADVMLWLSAAPNVSQGGQSYSFTAEERNDFKSRAKTVYGELGTADDKVQTIAYGYKGENL